MQTEQMTWPRGKQTMEYSIKKKNAIQYRQNCTSASSWDSEISYGPSSPPTMIHSSIDSRQSLVLSFQRERESVCVCVCLCVWGTWLLSRAGVTTVVAAGGCPLYGKHVDGNNYAIHFLSKPKVVIYCQRNLS